jgi:alpha-glucosidase
MRRSTHFAQFGVPSAPAPAFEPLGSAAVVPGGAGSIRMRSVRHTVEVAALAPDLFPVGLFGDGRPVEYRSEAVARQDWQPTGVQVGFQDDGARISAGWAMAYITFDPLRIRFEDAACRTFGRTDAEGVHIEMSAPEGSYVAARDLVELEIRGVERPERVMVNGQSVDDWQHAGERRLVLRLPAGRAARIDLER